MTRFVYKKETICVIGILQLRFDDGPVNLYYNYKMLMHSVPCDCFIRAKVQHWYIVKLDTMYTYAGSDQFVFSHINIYKTKMWKRVMKFFAFSPSYFCVFVLQIHCIKRQKHEMVAPGFHETHMIKTKHTQYMRDEEQQWILPAL